jgi:hypothetical protein
LNPAALGRFAQSKFDTQLKKLHAMKGFWAMLWQVCGQVRNAEPVGGVGGDGDGALFFFFFFIPMPKRLLGSEPLTKRLKKDKARRKVVNLEVFIVNCFLNETVRKSEQEATVVSDKRQLSDPGQRPASN